MLDTVGTVTVGKDLVEGDGSTLPVCWRVFKRHFVEKELVVEESAWGWDRSPVASIFKESAASQTHKPGKLLMRTTVIEQHFSSGINTAARRSLLPSILFTDRAQLFQTAWCSPCSAPPCVL